MRRLVIAPLVVAAFAPVLVGVACADTTPPPPTTTPSPVPFTVLVTDTDTQGRVFTDPNGQVLYRYAGDNVAVGTFGCVAACLKTHPPLLTTPGTPLRMPPGVAGTLSATLRPDGVGDQVTLNGAPLYTFTGDQPGDTNGVAPDWHAAQALPAPPSPAPPTR
ncbi:putative lipoprotein with Yx(FWY)xxD motif [Streptacidiphilus sp. MAP12-20]|uniref:COG4315 family predicted lipoprotein n=1 Tax=Streptacidiphilus sp. MAP12-20 TaxID=3156299 RepID=UPI0035170134